MKSELFLKAFHFDGLPRGSPARGLLLLGRPSSFALPSKALLLSLSQADPLAATNSFFCILSEFSLISTSKEDMELWNRSIVSFSFSFCSLLNDAFLGTSLRIARMGDESVGIWLLTSLSSAMFVLRLDTPLALLTSPSSVESLRLLGLDCSRFRSFFSLARVEPTPWWLRSSLSWTLFSCSSSLSLLSSSNLRL